MTARVPIIYMAALVVLVVAWAVPRLEGFTAVAFTAPALPALIAAALYLTAHGLRMLRLGLLSLDERERVAPLILCHGLTAFPCSLLPFKMGELLRLAAFFHVFGYRRKALAVWLVERFGDLVILTAVLAGFFVWEGDMAAQSEGVLAAMVLGIALALFSLLALSKLLYFLNHHLVLSGHRRRDLHILRLSEFLFDLEAEVHDSIRGRWIAFMLLSAFVWALEILAFWQLLSILAHHEASLGTLFADGFLGGLSLSGEGFMHGFEAHRSATLIVLAAAAAAPLWLARSRAPTTP